MPKVRTIQQRFTKGELDPKMKGRTDIDQYYGAAETMTNVFPIPQGGFRRRPGLEHIAPVLKQITREASPTITAPNGGTTANANDDNAGTQLTTTTGISTTNPYVVVHYDLGSAKDIGMIRLKGAHLSSGTSSEFYLQVSTDNSTWVNAGDAIDLDATGDDFTRRVHGSYRYVRFARIGSTNLTTKTVELDEMNVWVEGSISASIGLQFKFSTTQTYKMIFTDKNIAIYQNDVYLIDIYNEDYTHTVLDDGTMNWTASNDTLLLFHQDVPVKKLVRGSNNDDWTLSDITFDYIPKYDFVPSIQTPSATLTPSAKEGNITLTASAAVFVVGTDEDQYIEGNGGRARIVEVTSTTVVKATVEIPFFDTNVIASGDWELLSGFEDVWSSTRGYPRSGTFYEGRLWLGGSKSRPQTLWGSRTGLFFDFDPGGLLDDDGIDTTLDTDSLNTILNLYAGRALQIFTTGAEFVVLQTLGDPITPTKANTIKKQTSIGSEEGIRPQEVEGTVMFVQKGGKSIKGFVYDDTQQAFNTGTISKLSSHLVINPVDLDLRRSTSTDEGAYLLLVNGDGTMMVGNILLSDDIAAMVKVTTDGNFKNAFVDEEDMYVIVERTINSVTRRWIEKFNFSHTTDASVRPTITTTQTVFTDLDHLEGETVKVIADDSMLGDETVSSGSITIDRAVESGGTCEIGLDYSIEVKDLPVEVPEAATTLGIKKNISEVILRLYETADIAINGQIISFRGFGGAGAGSPFDSPPPQFTGTKKLRGFRGWDFDAQITITQNNPLPLTVLSVSKRVNISRSR